MFNNYIVEIEENKILDISLIKKLPMRSSYKILKSIINSDNLSEVNIDISRKKVYVIVEGEEVYIKLVKIPRVNYNKIEDLIKGELIYYFKDIESILFTYSILNETDNFYEIIVFCLNADKIQVLKKNYSDNANIKGIYLIQFCILNFMKKIIHDENFNLVFSSKKALYLIEAKSNTLKRNCVIKEVISYEEFKNKVDYFIRHDLGNNVNINTYFANIEDKTWLREYLMEEVFKDLGKFKENDIIESFTIRGK